MRLREARVNGKTSQEVLLKSMLDRMVDAAQAVCTQMRFSHRRNTVY